MTAPAVAAARLGRALVLGVPLGLWYGFLRPLRPRHTTLSDLLFLPGLFWAWLYLAFGICLGDLRLAHLAALAAGALLTDRTLGRLFAPVFRRLWTLSGKIWGIVCFPLKKSLGIMKKVLHM